MANKILTPDQIYHQVKDEINALWGTRIVGRALEIQTPFVTLNDKFVSLYLVHDEGQYIFADNCDIYEGTYGELFPSRRHKKYIKELAEHYHIKESIAKGTTTPIFGNRTNDYELVGSRVIDLAHFIQQTINVIYLT